MFSPISYTLLEIKVAYSFQRGVNTFLELIEQLNEMKINAQKEGLSTIRNIAKLLMNSMYGRFGMHSILDRTIIIPSSKVADFEREYSIQKEIRFENNSLISYTIKDLPKMLGNNSLSIKFKEFIDSLPGRTNEAIASAVTAYSRMLINQAKLAALELGLEIYYSDTDSLVTNGPLPSEMIDSSILGKLKLEHTIKEGIFVMPKVYYLETSEGQIVTKTKGLPGKLNKEQYLQLLEGKNIKNLLITKWQHSLKDSKVQILRNQSYTVQFTFNKRHQILENQILLRFL